MQYLSTRGRITLAIHSFDVAFKTNKVRAQSKSTRIQSWVTLQYLRSMPHLKRKAEQDMRILQEDSSDEEVLIPESVGKKVKSGQSRKVTDQVKHELNWPHTNLKYAYANMQLNYCDLDFPLLVPGKISIIMNSNITDVDKNGRLELLSAVAYHTKNYHWKSILDFHSTCLLEIEKGERQWDQNDNYIPIVANTLYNTVNSNKLKRFTKSNNRPINSTKRWFCKPFQKNNCAIRGNHDAIIQCQSRHVKHICATCFLHDGSIAEHPETSNDCPLKQN